MNWEDAAKLLSQNNSGGKFFRLGPGESAKGVAGIKNVKVRSTVWNNGASEDYDAKNPAHSGLRPSQRFGINWWSYETNEMQIWEMSKTTFQAVVAAVGMPPKARVLRIKRIGEGKSTVYDVEVRDDLQGDEFERIKTAFARDSYDLDQELTPSPSGASGGGSFDDDDIPF